MRRSILIASVLFSTLFLSGCVGQPKAPQPVVIDKTLPQVSVNGYLSDADAIAFEWKPIQDPRVKGVRIYRDNPGSGDEKVYRIAAVDDLLHTHYIDRNLAPSTTYRYRFTTVDAKGRESMPDNTISAATRSLPEAVSFFTATKELARGAKLLWRPHPDQRVTGYAIERLDPGEKEFRRIDSVQGRLNAEYIDHGLEDHRIYRYRIRALTFDQKATAPSEVVTVTTKPLPLSPKNLFAGTNAIRSVTLEWSPSETKGIDYYKIYRSKYTDGAFEYRAKVTGTTFTDKPEEDGTRFFYKVSAVDKDGLESPQSEMASGTTRPAPKVPMLTELTRQNGAVVIHWRSDDPRAVAFEVHKTARQGWFDSKETVIRDIKTTTFTDVNVAQGLEYSYSVVAVDANGLKSAPSAGKTILLEAQ